MKRCVSFGITSVLVCVIGLVGAVRPAIAGITERVSIASDGTEGNGGSRTPSVSGDGRFVAFFSSADNLIEDDTNGKQDIFVHDGHTGQTERVSVASDGMQGNDVSINAVVSADGRFLAFYSAATNLVEGDSNGYGDIFVHDRETDQTTRVSVASDGTQGNDNSFVPSISGDGRLVAFYSDASNLVPGDTNGYHDAFVHDRRTGQTTRISVASDGTQADNKSMVPSLSTDGRFVAFYSYAENLVEGDTNGWQDVFVHDRETGETARVSVATDGTQGNGHSQHPAMSADGRFVAFLSAASSLVEGDSNGYGDIFIHDRQTGETTRVSVESDGTQGSGDSLYPSVSADGRFVAFYSYASDLVSGDTNGAGDMFVHDRQTGQTQCVSVASDGTQGNASPYRSSINADGRFVAFVSSAGNLVEGDTNGAWDIFVHDRGVTLTVTTSGSGTGTVDLSPPGGIYDEGTTVTLTAVASAGNVFDHWEGDLTGSANPANILMDDDKTVTAHFALLRQLTVLSAPTDGAAVTGDEPATTPYTAVCTDQQLVTLTAPAILPSASSRANHFLYWVVDDVAQPYGQDELQLTMDTDHKATAVYDWRLPGDVNGDCTVNVLDMIFVRNHARTSCSE